MDLIGRLDRVCADRGWSDRAWSLRAGLSAQYVHTARVRAARDTDYRLPERGAAALATAAEVDADWLRFGRGTMRAATPTTAPPSSSVRAAFVQQLARAVAELTAAGDDQAARGASQLLTELLTEDGARGRLARGA